MADKTVQVRIDTRATEKALSDIERKQFPFVLAKTVTGLAKGAQEQIRKELPRRFHIRNTWTAKGIRIEPAQKATVKSKGFAEAVVKDVDPYMATQEAGGPKRLRSHGRATGTRKRIAVPIDPKLRTTTGKIRSGKKPAQILNKTTSRGIHKAFIIKAASGVALIAMRSTKKRFPLKFLYTLTPKARIQPRFHFKETVQSYTDKNFKRVFDSTMRKALSEGVKP